jgi:glycosyltransferase involved in cell wall biosynthesis
LKFDYAIVIPVYQGRHRLIALIPEIQKWDIKIVIVDDGSSDGIRADDFDPNITLLTHEINRGKGAALQTGLNWLKGNGFSHAITMDADGQHAPESIGSFLETSKSSPQSLIYGRRNIKGSAMPLDRRFSNIVTSALLSLFVGTRIYDSQVGFRLYPLKQDSLWTINEDGFQFESAIFFRAKKLAIPLKWVEIPVIYGNESSHMDYINDTLKFVKLLMTSIVKDI